ncbi:hypothetical protein C5B98_04385 [Rathayibacter sp. AY1A5]|nr:hypothetical protein C5B98_04385 [Rathayibacter sp. AY1A5]
MPGSASRPADADVHRLVRSGGREVERPEPRRRHVAQERLRTDQREERLRAQAQVGVGVGGADAVEGPVEVGAAEPPAAQTARASVSDGEGAAAESDRKRRGIVHPATVPPPDPREPVLHRSDPPPTPLDRVHASRTAAIPLG